MNQDEIFSIVDQHFAFETPELIERVCETFAEDVTWEAPARGLRLRNHKEILEQYHKITAGILEPVEIVPIRRFSAGEEVFDDRVMYFTAGKDNVWEIPEGSRVQLRLVHYFRIRDYKIHQEIGYETWKVIK